MAVCVNIVERVNYHTLVSLVLVGSPAIATVTIGTTIFSRMNPMPFAIFVHRSFFKMAGYAG
jgi:hypothetical protein